MSRHIDEDNLARQVEADWAADASLRAEFNGNKDAYRAWLRACAAGQVKVFAPAVSAQTAHVGAPAPVAPRGVDLLIGQRARTLADRS